MQEERWVETTYLRFTFCKHWHFTSSLFRHALLKIVQKLSSACPSNDLSLSHLLWQSLIQDAGWQSHASRGVWERMWVDIANYITLIVVALIYGTVRNNFCAIIQCDIWYHAVSTSIISIWIAIFQIVGFHGYRLLFYLQIELAVSSGASLSRLETAPLGSGRSSLPPLLFLSFFLSPLLFLFSSPSSLSLLLFTLPYSAQLSLEPKEAFHLNLNLLACQQLSGRSKVSGHHDGSELLSSSILPLPFLFAWKEAGSKASSVFTLCVCLCNIKHHYTTER